MFSGEEITGWGRKLKSYDRRCCHVSSHWTLVQVPGGTGSAGASSEPTRCTLSNIMVGILQAVSFVTLYFPAVLHKSPEKLDFLAPFKPFCVTINKADYIVLVLNDSVFFYPAFKLFFILECHS